MIKTDAARVDGLSEYRIYGEIALPLVRPALTTVAVFTMIPIWNDLWCPLILTTGAETRTVTLGVQQFIGRVDVMCRITGSRPVRVQGMGARLSPEIAPDMYNYGHLQVFFEDGSVGWYEAGWVR